METADLSGAHDFNFQVGAWHVRHRRLTVRLQNSDAWEEFGGRCDMQLTLGGMGNIEQNVLDIASGRYHAIAIRAFDADAGTWAIWWLDGRAPHALDVPVIGRFTDGVGEFTTADTVGDRPVLVRFLWLRTHTESPRWEQAMSLDGGASWETNWEMDFTRA